MKEEITLPNVCFKCYKQSKYLMPVQTDKLIEGYTGHVDKAAHETEYWCLHCVRGYYRDKDKIDFGFFKDDKEDI